MDPNWIVAIAAIIYAFLTYRLLSEHQKSQLNDKFPCVVVRARRNPFTNTLEIGLVNVGRGPAFIQSFDTNGLSHLRCSDGDHTDDIDNVIGPNAGNPDLQVVFAYGESKPITAPDVTVVIHYRDIAGRLFKSRFVAGKLDYERPQ
jgi:hypothetical protein